MKHFVFGCKEFRPPSSCVLEHSRSVKASFVDNRKAACWSSKSSCCGANISFCYLFVSFFRVIHLAKHDFFVSAGLLYMLWNIYVVDQLPNQLVLPTFSLQGVDLPVVVCCAVKPANSLKVGYSKKLFY